MKFVQIHELISYPASNLNRDDLGRPKTIKIGDANRIRISSQSLKRAWRTSEYMSEAFPELGIRTNKLSDYIEKALLSGNSLHNTIRGVDEPDRQAVDVKTAHSYALRIDECVRAGKAEVSKKAADSKEGDGKTASKKQLFHYSDAELRAIDDFMKTISEGSTSDVPMLTKSSELPADIAMFGRMVAEAPQFNCEAAVQVAHAFTVNKAMLESDFFTAVDDLSEDDNSGAGHLGDLSYGAGLFYIYICVDMELLQKNIGSKEKAVRALNALVDAAAKITPTGKQSTFASRAYASYILVEEGSEQPRSLSSAFLKPIRGENLLNDAVSSIRDMCSKMDAVYGACADGRYEICVDEGKGTMEALHEFLS